MKIKNLLFIMVLSLFTFNASAQWKLVWSDEFDTDGAIDDTKWSCDTGPVYNNEMEAYTAGTANTTVANGNLIMEVKQESFNGKNYTSSRINTKDKAGWLYGKFEARMKLPEGTKLWPAFWMMPETDTYGGWPNSGEIDIMEHWSWDNNATFGNYHCKDYFGKYGLRTATSSPSSTFHLYGLEWSADKLTFLLDNVVYATYNNPKAGSSTWPFDQPFYLILNIAVESGATGNEGTWTKKTAEVDYVRVYEASTTSIETQVNSPKNELTFYPNPVIDNVVIENIYNEKSSQLNICNLAGVTVFSELIAPYTSKATINLTDLKSGIYFAKLKSENSTSTQRIVKL